jgi:hypothetical protein
MLMFELVLLLLFVKHYLFDFVWQTASMIQHKGVYGDFKGIIHSLGHSVGTFIVIVLLMGPIWALIIAVVDGLIHYHVDWIKMNYGENDMSNPQFWNHLGLDQLAHSLTYVFIAGFVLRSL